MKRCGSCQTNKPVSEFSKNAARKDGLQSVCRKCKGEIQRRYYHNNRESYQQTSRRSKTNRVARNRQFVVDYLVQNPCVDCGELDVHVLEFDHVLPGKISGVGKMVCDGESLSKIQNEIAKCEVRCCNCHRRVTYQRRGIDFTQLL